MQIAEIEVDYLSDYDGRPIKDHLDERLVKDLKTQIQWLEKGFIPKKGATPYEMHPSFSAKRINIYFHKDDMEPIPAGKVEKCCLTCKSILRKGRYCEASGDFISASGCCSVWEF